MLSKDKNNDQNNSIGNQIDFHLRIDDIASCWL